MVATTFASRWPSTIRSDTTSTDLVLRVCNSPRNGQLVRLKAAKCTIGSGPRCTLRLRALGVAPLHCLILRGRKAAVVRCWAADTRLNHQSFADAVLSPGDRLSIGPIDLEVVSVGVAPTTADQPSEASGQPASRVAVDDEVQRLRAEAEARIERERNALEDDRRQLTVLEADLRQHEASLSAQAEQLASQYADLQAQQQTIDQQRQQWQAEQVHAQSRLDEHRKQIGEQLTALASQRTALAEERRKWEAERDEASFQLPIQLETLTARQADVDAQQNALAEERRKWETERNATSAQLVDESQKLHAQWTEMVSEQETFRQQQQQWQAEQAEIHRQLDKERQDLSLQQSELEAGRNALAEERRQWERQQAELPTRVEPSVTSSAATAVGDRLPEQESGTSAKEAPVELADVLRRLGAKFEVEDEEPTPGAPAVSSERSFDGTAQPAAEIAAAPAKEENGEESIDDYMRRLMQRVRSDTGTSEPASYTPPPSSREALAAAAAAATAVSARPEAAYAASATPRSEPIAMGPRTVAPEKHIDLMALRELAILSASSAIGLHTRNVIRRTMYSKLMVTLLAVVAGGALLGMWSHFGASQLTYFAALVAILVTLYWGTQYALLTGRLTISKSGHIDWNISPQNAIPAQSADEKTVEGDTANQGVAPTANISSDADVETTDSP